MYSATTARKSSTTVLIGKLDFTGVRVQFLEGGCQGDWLKPELQTFVVPALAGPARKQFQRRRKLLNWRWPYEEAGTDIDLDCSGHPGRLRVCDAGVSSG